MSEKLKESLSAVIDGEADEFELRRVLDEIGKNGELAKSWERYHLIGAVMRRERVVRAPGMRERIWAELEFGGNVAAPEIEESGAPDAVSAGRPHYGRWTSLAVAAGVAFAVVIGFSELPVPGAAPAPETAATDLAIEARQQSLDQVVALREEVTDLDQTRTDAYIISHHQRLGMNQNGIGAFTRMVAYERN